MMGEKEIDKEVKASGNDGREGSIQRSEGKWE